MQPFGCDMKWPGFGGPPYAPTERRGTARSVNELARRVIVSDHPTPHHLFNRHFGDVRLTRHASRGMGEMTDGT
jgi:hypothetical protein